VDVKGMKLGESFTSDLVDRTTQVRSLGVNTAQTGQMRIELNKVLVASLELREELRLVRVLHNYLVAHEAIEDRSSNSGISSVNDVTVVELAGVPKDATTSHNSRTFEPIKLFTDRVTDQRDITLCEQRSFNIGRWGGEVFKHPDVANVIITFHGRAEWIRGFAAIRHSGQKVITLDHISEKGISRARASTTFLAGGSGLAIGQP
jgi:hypothetical protein